jgi:uncharacterized membrane protein YgcG
MNPVIPRNMTAGCALLVFSAGLAGCHPVVQKSAEDKWLAVTVQDAAVRNGILTQQTLYPYHFVENSAELNSLGQMDLAVLADHYRLYPGELGLRRGRTRADVYDARVKAVREILAANGVDNSRMRFDADSLQGGDGMTSERVIRVLEASYEASKASEGGTGSGGGGSSGSSSGGSSSSSGSGSSRSGGR